MRLMRLGICVYNNSTWPNQKRLEPPVIGFIDLGIVRWVEIAVLSCQKVQALTAHKKAAHPKKRRA
jgi:hypothetical protein